MKTKKDYSYIIDLIEKDNQKELRKELPELIEHITTSLMATVTGFTYDELYEITISFYVTIHEKIVSGKLKEGKTLLSYYYITVRNHCFTLSRERTTLAGDLKNPLSFTSDTFKLPKEGPDHIEFIEKMEQEDEISALYKAIAKLPELHKKVIKLTLDFPDISSKDGSAALGIKDAHFRISKYRAIKELRRLLSKEYIRVPQH